MILFALKTNPLFREVEAEEADITILGTTAVTLYTFTLSTVTLHNVILPTVTLPTLTSLTVTLSTETFFLLYDVSIPPLYHGVVTL